MQSAKPTCNLQSAQLPVLIALSLNCIQKDSANCKKRSIALFLSACFCSVLFFGIVAWSMLYTFSTLTAFERKRSCLNPG